MREKTYQLSPELQRQLKYVRRRFEGTKNILKFNWPFYVLGFLVIVGGGCLIPIILSIPNMPLQMMQAAVLAWGLALQWWCLSICAAFAVYDFSELYTFRWFFNTVDGPPDHLLNLHAGFDETSRGLRILFPDARIQVFDFYSAERSTEPSIARARLEYQKQPPGTAVQAIPVGLTGWDLPDESQDVVHLFMSAHELRKPEDREALFAEVHRVLKPKGEVILVEHLRDWLNFIAFGPGYFHFYPRREWLRLAKKCGFKVRLEKKIAGLVQVFYLCKQ